MTRTRKAVVVGVDGSEASRVALRRAVEEAHLRGATLEVVHAVGWDAPDTAFSFTDRSTVAAGAAHLIDDLLAEELPARDRDGIVTMVREGHASDVLVEQSDGALLLVVGSRGRGGLVSAVLGSVSLHCTIHAHCPVLVVPPALTQVHARP